MRFLFAADLCQDWSSFGGLGPHLAHFSTAPHLGVTETVGAALSYIRLVGRKLQEKARKRTNAPLDFAALLSAESFDLEAQAKRQFPSPSTTDVREKEKTKKPPVRGERRPSFLIERKQ